MSEFIDEQREPQREQTPTLSEVLKKLQRSSMAEMKVSVPAEVVKYDHKTQKADVKPHFKRKYNDNKSESPAIIYSVPVWHPRAGGAFVHVPVAKGDIVQLIFSDRSLEKWLTSGKETDPEDTRMHHVSDAIAYPGGYPFSNPADVNNSDDLIIKNDDLEIRVKKNGHLQVFNSSYELMKVIEEWMNASISGSINWKIRIRNKFRSFIEN